MIEAKLYTNWNWNNYKYWNITGVYVCAPANCNSGFDILFISTYRYDIIDSKYLKFFTCFTHCLIAPPQKHPVLRRVTSRPSYS